jgi:hypothetical protein
LFHDLTAESAVKLYLRTDCYAVETNYTPPYLRPEKMKRNSKLGFIISLHLSVFAAAVYPPNTVPGLFFGAASAAVLGVTLFYEVTQGPASEDRHGSNVN